MPGNGDYRKLKVVLIDTDKNWSSSHRQPDVDEPDYRVWKGFCVIRDLAEIERVIRGYRKSSRDS